MRKLLKQNWQTILKITGALAVLILAFILVPKIEGWIGTDRIADFATSSGIWGKIGYIAVRAISIIAAPLTLGPFGAIADRALGFRDALIVGVIAEFLGATVNFFLGRKFGVKIVKFFIGEENANKASEFSHHYLNRNLAITTGIMLGFNYELASYACGISKMPAKRFLLALAIAVAISKPLIILQNLQIGQNNFITTAIYLSLNGISALCLVLSTRRDLKSLAAKTIQKIKKEPAV